MKIEVTVVETQLHHYHLLCLSIIFFTYYWDACYFNLRIFSFFGCYLITLKLKHTKHIFNITFQHLVAIISWFYDLKFLLPFAQISLTFGDCVNSSLLLRYNHSFVHNMFRPHMTIILLTYILTYGAGPVWRSSQLYSYSTASQNFTEPEGSLPCS
jgi:hypothetical protein